MSGDTVQSLPPHLESLTPGSEFDVDRVSRFAIDQAVVDGLADGADLRVRLARLRGMAFKGIPVADDVQERFRLGLAADERFIDEIRELYAFEPVVSDGTEVVARPIAVVEGRGIFTEERREEVLGLMDSCVRTLYAACQSLGKDRLAFAEIGKTLREKGFDLTNDEFTGLMSYVRLDSRVRFTGEVAVLHSDTDGQAQLPDLGAEGARTQPKKTLPLPQVKDYGPAIERALPRIVTKADGTFTVSALLGTLKAIGDPVGRGPEVVRALAQFRDHPNVESAGDGLFKIINEVAEAAPTPRPSKPRDHRSLDSMMRDAFKDSGQRRKKLPSKRSRRMNPHDQA